ELEREAIWRFVEDQLLTKGGHRDSRDVADTLGADLFSAAALEALVRRRLLRYEQRGGGERRVELSHDVLLKVAVESRAQRQSQRDKADLVRKAEQAAREKEEADARDWRSRRQLFLTRAALAAALVGLLAGAAGAVAAL